MVTGGEQRLAVFLSPATLEIFHSIEHRHEIWKTDPFDVASLYTDAREVFHNLLERAITPPGLSSGRILLIKGESGSGKTHLLRTFRNQVHDEGKGFVGYLQMTTATGDYGRYLLTNLIDSLDQPYREHQSPESGLMRLSRAIASRCLGPGALARLRKDEEIGQEGLDALVSDAADELICRPEYAGVDLNLVRALLYLQCDDPRIKMRVLQYLRCEDLTSADRSRIGGLAPRIHDGDPGRTVEAIGRLIWSGAGRSLVMCLDQLEDIWNMDEAAVRFRKAMGAVCDLADRVPSSIVVICCLEDFYDQMREKLTNSARDRIEKDPAPIRLKSERSLDEVQQLVGRRLQYLYQQHKAPFDDSEPTFPIPPAAVARWETLPTREVLDGARKYREEAVALGRLPEVGERSPTHASTPPPPSPQPDILGLQQAWNDFRASYRGRRPEEEQEIEALLGWGIEACSDELESGHSFVTQAVEGGVEVDIRKGGQSIERLLVAVCNKSTRGGGLAGQVAKVRKEAGVRKVAIVRTTEFPSQPGSKVAEELGKVIETGGRRALLEDADCLTMLALRDFRLKHAVAPNLAVWLGSENPLSRLQVMRQVLGLDRFEPAGSVPVAPPPRNHAPVRAAPEEPAPVKAAPEKPTPLKAAPERAAPVRAAPGRPAPVRAAPERAAPFMSAAVPTSAPGPAAPSDAQAPRVLLLGKTEGITPQELTMPSDALNKHAAFLGGTGSGKTTLALGLVEQLLLQSVPVVLVDRKGDLCRYLHEKAWSEPLGDPAREQVRRRLRERVVPALYTPGGTAGRPLGITLMPTGIQDLPPDDRDEEATHAAGALGDMLGYKHHGRDQSCRAILVQALRLLASSGVPGSLEALVRFIDDQDPALVSAIGRLDTKLFTKLVQDLETFKLTNVRLLAGEGEQLDIDALLGLDGNLGPGRTRLCVVSTKFLGDSGKVLFWVAQLLIQLGRWASRRPSRSGALQAAILFDEADMYLPAVGQPATKAPMENLLRRARSAGLGLLLATQSPGDFDYRCRDNINTWMLGRITQPVAIQKMRPMLEDSRVDVAGKLAGRQVGQFFLLRNGDVSGFTSRLPAILPAQLPEEEILALARASRR